jgi:hypothetical protein
VQDRALLSYQTNHDGSDDPSMRTETYKSFKFSQSFQEQSKLPYLLSPAYASAELVVCVRRVCLDYHVRAARRAAHCKGPYCGRVILASLLFASIEARALA